MASPTFTKGSQEQECCLPKTRRHSHLTYAAWGPSVSINNITRSRALLWFIAGMLTAFAVSLVLPSLMMSHCNGCSASVLLLIPVPTTMPQMTKLSFKEHDSEGVIAVDEPYRSRMYYNVGWQGGPITLAKPDARYKPQGQHIMLDVYESDAEFLNDMEAMTRVSRELLLDAGMHILYARPTDLP